MEPLVDLAAGRPGLNRSPHLDYLSVALPPVIHRMEHWLILLGAPVRTDFHTQITILRLC